MGVIEKGIMTRQSKAWGIEECPACNSTNVAMDNQSGDMICQKCGLVIY